MNKIDLIPVDFPESNKVLGKPVDMTDEECKPLPVFSDGVDCVSCWKLSFRQKLKILFSGRIWLMVMSGWTQPPVCLCSETPIRHPDPDADLYTDPNFYE